MAVLRPADATWSTDDFKAYYDERLTLAEMGYHRAAEALMLGEPFMAEAALEVGLVNRILPPTEVNDMVQTLARRLAAKPIGSLIETKRLMKKGQMEQVLAQIEEEGANFARLLQEPAAKEAFTAFLEKRKPDFSKTS